MSRIRIAPRAKVTDEVVALLRDLSEKKLRMIHDKAKVRGPGHLKANRVAIGRLLAIRNGVVEPGRGLDQLLTKLRNADFERFDVETVDGHDYIYGVTNPLTMEVINSRARKATAHYDVGPYILGIRANDLLNGRLDGWHVVPQRAPNIQERHPHHRGRVNNHAQSDHYFNRSPHTCWSDFATPVRQVMDDLNIPEVFRVMYLFAGRYYSGSPLCRSYLHQDFVKEVQE